MLREMLAQLKELSKSVVTELVTSPLNLLLLAVCLFLVYKIFNLQRRSGDVEAKCKKEDLLPKMKKRDFTVDELLKYNGSSNEDKRILVSVNHKVFDVTNNGKDYYGPEGPYAAFAGRDASRSLATFSLDASGFKEKFDDLSDLTPMQLESLKEWELQFTDKYDFVGKLLKPNEAPTDYSDTDEDDDEDADDEAGGEEADEEENDDDALVAKKKKRKAKAMAMMSASNGDKQEADADDSRSANTTNSNDNNSSTITTNHQDVRQRPASGAVHNNNNNNNGY